MEKEVKKETKVDDLVEQIDEKIEQLKQEQKEEQEKEKKHKEKENKKNKKHKEEIKKLNDQIAKLQKDILVAKADMINYRKRKEEETAKMLKYCNEGLIKELLPVIDNFERALKLSEGKVDESFIKLSEGYKMVYAGLENILAKYEVKAIDGSHKEFDPIYHNAVMIEHVDGIEPGMVLEVLQKGYLYKDKVIRPAMVKVSE